MNNNIPTLSCAIIDDEPTARYGIASYINRTPCINCVGEFHDIPSFEAYLKTNKAPDIVFMDICMPEVSGLDFISNCTIDSAIIIITAYEQYALKGYELNISDYLLKPVSYIRFQKAIDKVRQYLDFKRNATVEDYIFVRSDRIIHRIDLRDIVYIESLENYVRIMTVSDCIIVRTTLKDILKSLPAEKFVQVHKSFIINLTRIGSIEKNVIKMNPVGEINISRNYKKYLFQLIEPENNRFC